MDQIIENIKNSMETILLTCYEIESTATGYHLYRNSWKPIIEEVLNTFNEPQNEVDKYAVSVLDSDNTVVGHLRKGKSGKYAKTIFYFLISFMDH